ncbi:mitochondrial carrier domain-containing protein [Aspergillus aurantiobrunneus]
MAAVQERNFPLGKIEPNSLKYFGACTMGGIVVDPKIYTSNISAWRSIIFKEGLRGIFFGWSPTFIGYSFQGAGKYGFYEYFKYLYGDRMFPNTNRTILYLGASASAEFFADIALCPFEAIKVRMQTTLPPCAHTLREGWSRIVAKEGMSGLYKGLYPLWARQIPYTMTKFATFEETVSMIYRTLGKPKESYNSLQQTGVSFAGGYIAGIFCAIVSHPADVLVSKLNADRQAGESAMKAVSRIYGNIGFSGLWNGLPVRILMLGTLTGFQWLIMEMNAWSADRLCSWRSDKMEPRVSTSQPSTNPPSVEIAYKRKCIALKKRLSEIEAENELMRTRNRRGWQYIQKMRLESCILLERLATVTGMAEEAQAGVNPELRARAAAMMSSSANLNAIAANRNGSGPGYYEDETEGSSDEQPPTPQERPLRVKRSRKSNLNIEDDEMPATGTTPEASGTGPSSAWPRLAPAPSQEEMTSSFRIQQGNGSGPEKETPHPSDREAENRDASRERVVGPSAEASATPMDLDTKELKEESQG